MKPFLPVNPFGTINVTGGGNGLPGLRHRRRPGGLLMAPPIPGLRKPVQVRRRTAGDVLAGIGAIILLTALTVGVPIALVAVVGLPIPHTMPKLTALTSQLDITAILRILSVIIWLAWIQLVWCVLVEVKAAASETATPRPGRRCRWPAPPSPPRTGWSPRRCCCSPRPPRSPPRSSATARPGRRTRCPPRS